MLKMFEINIFSLMYGFAMFKFLFLPVILPVALILLWIFEIILFGTLKVSLFTLVVLFVILPIIFKNCLGIRKAFVFLNFVQWPSKSALLNPENQGMEATRNLYVTNYSELNKKEISLGVWHVLPAKYKNWTSLIGESSSNEEPENSKDDIFDSLLAKGDRPIVLYAHGNANNRACSHRVELYKVLQNLDFHIITFDYRSYGDSTSADLTEQGLVEDTMVMYKWILNKVTENGRDQDSVPNIFLWGHSLGTGVSTIAVAKLFAEASEATSSLIEPRGLILECPYNNMYEELQGHVLGKIYSWTPWFHWSIVNPVVDSGMRFQSDEFIGKFNAPVLMLHAKDDTIVPYGLAIKLLLAARAARPKSYGEVEIILFDANLNYGHKYLCRSPRFPAILGDFVKKHSKEVPTFATNGFITTSS